MLSARDDPEQTFDRASGNLNSSEQAVADLCDVAGSPQPSSWQGPAEGHGRACPRPSKAAKPSSATSRPRGEGSHRNQRNNPMHLHMRRALRCRARTRRGSPCQSPAMKNGRCRMHGGTSPGAPKGNKNALQARALHGGGNCTTSGGRGTDPRCKEIDRKRFLGPGRGMLFTLACPEPSEGPYGSNQCLDRG